ncbi:transmembrane protease serine 13b [Denticeps clupeoides]|uniref:Transmembrane protease serine 13-like n=1 Tax=Denticeps clupeoides TaxID=299321 RepID=A0AAY4AND2_9TELE|nr:transmembrane protease serine 13-like [Denticeps clupeoides]
MDTYENDLPPPYYSVAEPYQPPPPYIPKQEEGRTWQPPQHQPPYTPQNPVVVTHIAPPISSPPHRNRACCYCSSGGTLFFMVLLGIAVWLGIHYGRNLDTKPTETNPLTVISPSTASCNGQSEASRNGDESHCVRFGPADQLQVMTSKAGRFLPLCSEGWATHLADLTCAQLGFRKSYNFSTVNTSEVSFLSVTNKTSNIIQGKVEFSTSCPSQQTVSLQCSDCGKSQTTTKIIGGTAAKLGQWPWQVSLRYLGSHTCGGSLVSQDFVITAAHCFPSDGYQLPANWRIYMGMVSQLKLPPAYTVKQIITHENYNPETHENDIALLKLNSPVQYSDTIKPVCLPAFDQMLSPGANCSTTGFGTTTEGAATTSLQLMQVFVEIISSKQCNSPGVYNGQITETMLCAGDLLNGQKDSCQGDSGGPLVCQKDKKWYLTGVTSWGVGCGRKYLPGVYTNVNQLLPWIYSKMQEERP